VDALGIATVDGAQLRLHAVHVAGQANRAGESSREAVARALDLSREEYDAIVGQPISLAGSGTEFVGSSRKSDACTDLRVERRFLEDERLLAHGVRAYARAPLFVGGRLVGSITYARWTPRPFSPDEVALLEQISGPIAGAVANALAYEEIARLKNRLQEENLALQRDIDEHFMLDDIIGSSPALRSVLAQVEKVAATSSTVLITGETGTGKELVARAIHRHSKRASRSLIKANLAALPESLIASELFGHERGAFTGALQRRVGRFELASGGSLFLDEVGELPADMQVALLRVLQEGEFERVGGQTTIRTDARVIAATNRDLAEDVASGRFRSDLFYRLNVFPIHVPALRERREDIPILVEFFAARHGARLGRRFEAVDRSVMAQLTSYDWPGNIRELQNIVERAAILSEGPLLRFPAPGPTKTRSSHAKPTPPSAPVSARDHERAVIEGALADSHGRVSGPRGAAVRLGLPASTVESQIRRLGIDKFRFKRGQ
jgi:formate hydrogenlyase transcriptional activator